MAADSMEDIRARWQAKYGCLDPLEREALVRAEIDEGLLRLQAAGIAPTMSAQELMALTRGDD